MIPERMESGARAPFFIFIFWQSSSLPSSNLLSNQCCFLLACCWTVQSILSPPYLCWNSPVSMGRRVLSVAHCYLTDQRYLLGMIDSISPTAIRYCLSFWLITPLHFYFVASGNFLTQCFTVEFPLFISFPGKWWSVTLFEIPVGFSTVQPLGSRCLSWVRGIVRFKREQSRVILVASKVHAASPLFTRRDSSWVIVIPLLGIYTMFPQFQQNGR